MTFMVAAYLVIWLAVFIFLMSMVRRQSNLQREIYRAARASRRSATARPVMRRRGVTLATEETSIRAVHCARRVVRLENRL